jgi:hypothetical protein
MNYKNIFNMNMHFTQLNIQLTIRNSAMKNLPRLLVHNLNQTYLSDKNVEWNFMTGPYQRHFSGIN